MRGFIQAMMVTFALCVSLPTSGRAETPASSVTRVQAIELPPLPSLPVPSRSSGSGLGIGAEQALYLGIGVVGGALIGNIILSGSTTALIGALAGGLLAHWYYVEKPDLFDKLPSFR